MMQFIAVIQAILKAGKQLQQFHIDEADDNYSSESMIGSKLLRKLILSASSSNLINVAAKLLSTISKEAADQRDLPNLMIINNDRFPKVCYLFESKCFIVYSRFLVVLHTFCSLYPLLYS